LRSNVTEANIGGLDADLIVIATGAVGTELTDTYDVPGVVAATVWEVLHGHDRLDADTRVTVIDDGTGDWPMLTAAQALAKRGHAVTIVTPGATPFRSIPGESLAGLRLRMRNAGVCWLAGALEIRPSAGVLSFTRDGTDERVVVATDAVVVETGRTPVDALWRGADGTVAIGDCCTPRGIGNAVGDAQQLQWSLRRSNVNMATAP
jgi:hypothetical protein